MKESIIEFKDLCNIKANNKYDKQQRGRAFEKYINKIFADENILINESYQTSDGKSEQIDGAIKVNNRIILVETKWVESNLAASELYSFIGKVENKFSGTIGLFISRIKLKDNFINALNKGRRQSIIVIHGEDIDNLIKEDIKFNDFIEFVIEKLKILITKVKILKFQDTL